MNTISDTFRNRWSTSLAVRFSTHVCNKKITNFLISGAKSQNVITSHISIESLLSTNLSPISTYRKYYNKAQFMDHSTHPDYSFCSYLVSGVPSFYSIYLFFILFQQLAQIRNNTQYFSLKMMCRLFSTVEMLRRRIPKGNKISKLTAQSICYGGLIVIINLMYLYVVVECSVFLKNMRLIGKNYI